MRISIKVKPNSKEDLVEKTGENEYTVRIKAPAKEGKANESVVKVLSEYFRRPKGFISIIRGQTGRNKVIDIS